MVNGGYYERYEDTIRPLGYVANGKEINMAARKTNLSTRKETSIKKSTAPAEMTEIEPEKEIPLSKAIKNYANSFRDELNQAVNGSDGTEFENYLNQDDSKLRLDFDSVSNPMHYTEGRKYEPRKVIMDWGLDFYLGNAVKYISRAGRKGDAIEDLQKAIQYMIWEIEHLMGKDN